MGLPQVQIPSWHQGVSRVSTTIKQICWAKGVLFQQEKGESQIL